MPSACHSKADCGDRALNAPRWLIALCLALLVIVFSTNASHADELKVGSKRFTESYILAEIIAQTARGAGEAAVAHRPGLGNTAILFAALKSGAIDLYPEYTGTLVQELLGGKTNASLESINAALQPLGLAAGIPLGFGNSYALAVSANNPNTAGLRSISDLARLRELRLGLSQEFLNRLDGWPALQKHYGLPQVPRGLDHGLAYDVLASAQIDVMDVYTTDAKISRYALRMLDDDRQFFPRYDALLLYRADLPQRLPKSWAAIRALEQKISAERMIAMNASVELEGRSFAAAAASYVNPNTIAETNRPPQFIERLFGADFGRLAYQHCVLVFLALALSVMAGIPLGIWAARSTTAHAFIMPAVGVLQTVPALALLAILIALLDRIGTVPAVIALFLYGLLPIVRNTATGLAEVPRGLPQAAAALGLRAGAIMSKVELPLAARTILAGIRISAVINVGTATIAAFIGAGGFGERIVAGLAVNDRAMLLAGAVPAALMAIAIEAIFGLCERRVSPGANAGRGRL